MIAAYINLIVSTRRDITLLAPREPRQLGNFRMPSSSLMPEVRSRTECDALRLPIVLVARDATEANLKSVEQESSRLGVS